MEHLLFAFGDYKEGEPTIKLIIDFVSQISKTDVKYQFGESGLIVNFTTKLNTEELSQFFETNLTKLTAMFFVFPVTDDMILSMDEDIHNHLFGETDKKSDKDMLKFTIDITDIPIFGDGDTTNPMEKLFSILSQPQKTKVHIPSLDELLDKISEHGIESLTEKEIEILNEYSK
jgi:hypothetical protein